MCPLPPPSTISNPYARHFWPNALVHFHSHAKTSAGRWLRLLTADWPVDYDLQHGEHLDVFPGDLTRLGVGIPRFSRKLIRLWTLPSRVVMVLGVRWRDLK